MESVFEMRRTELEQELLARRNGGPECSLNALAAEIVEINRANGWNVTQVGDWEKEYKVPALIALIHSEASEALEAFRTNDPANFREEMADVLIRVLDCLGGLQIDIASEVRTKLEKNKTRGVRHGGKRC